jgi:hypothetical protein
MVPFFGGGEKEAERLGRARQYGGARKVGQRQRLMEVGDDPRLGQVAVTRPNCIWASEVSNGPHTCVGSKFKMQIKV